MTDPDDPTSTNRIAPVLRSIGQGLARGADAVRRGVEAFDAPTRLANAREDLLALELDRRAALLARRGGSAARAAAGLARVRARRAADVGGPALRLALSRSAARLAPPHPPRPPRTPDPMARPVDLPAPAAAVPPQMTPPAPPRRAVPPAPLPLFPQDEPAASTPPPAPAAPAPITPAAPPPTPAASWLEDRKTQMTIGIGSLAIAGLAVAVAGGQPQAAGPAAAPGTAAFGEAVRAYILDHPEIIPEAIAKLQQRETDTAITANRTKLQTPFSGAWAGAAGGDVVLVEFTDYACGFCRASVRDIDRLMAEDRRLKVVYREIPILGPASEDAAIVALAAARQGRHADVHHALFAAGSPTPQKVAAVVAAQRLDPARIARDRADPVVAREIADNLALARTIGLTGTPTFVIGNHILSGAVGYDALKTAIADARAGR